MPSLDLTDGRAGAAPLWLLPDGSLSTSAHHAPTGLAAREALITAARWISGRRTSTFTTLFPPSAFHPERPRRTERLSLDQAAGLLEQVRGALAAAATGGEEAQRDPIGAAQIRSAALTVLSHLTATVRDDRGFRTLANAAAQTIFEIVDAEQGETAQSALRGHAIMLLQLRGAALVAADRARAVALLNGHVRAAPPYADLRGPWRFAMCSDGEFHEGECEVLVRAHHFRAIEVPEGAPTVESRWGSPRPYKAFEAPFKTPWGDPIQILARSASPDDENREMGEAFFTGVLINRHAQLGSFDLRAATVQVAQRGYKLMMNSQCAGLTTRFAISRLFPEADIYSSWDSTFFRTGAGGKVNASEGLDCFVAVLQGMSKRETFSTIDARIRRAQWSHQQATAVRDFIQFVGPAHPLVIARFSDVQQDGRADAYDGFLDFDMQAIAEDLASSMTPRDPGVAASQIGGEAATGLGWAAGSMNRVTQYSDLWAGLPGASELLYAFESAGFYSHREPPEDIPPGKLTEDPGLLPAVCRYRKVNEGGQRFRVEVMMHAFLGHAGKELKRLLVAADALWRAVDLGYLPAEGGIAEPIGQRAMLLLTLAGLLDFPADQNFIDGLWAMALKALRLPEISRSLVRGSITEQDHDADNYYGSRRGISQLLETLKKSDSLAYEKLASIDPSVGRAAPLDLGSG
ncbi:Hypothetical protein A7982_10436 [Minicystis rosea]|nr:Hypothetical protein A7982_10436 [Minicystis rosea]